MKKYLVTGLAALMAAAALATPACKKQPDPNDVINDVISSMLPSQNSPAPKDEATPAPQNEATQPPAQQEQREKSYETAAREFVEAIMKKDWDSALASMKLGEGSFVTPEDISWYFPRSSFKALAELDENSTCKVSSSSGGSDYQSVQISVAEQGGYSETVKVSMKMNKDNEWCVDASEFVNTNYTFRAPGGKTKVEVNGKELGKELISEKHAGSTGYGVDYTLPTVGKRDIEVRVSSENFDYTKILTPLSGNKVENEQDKVYPEIDDQDALYTAFRDIWNETYAAYHADGAKVSDIYGYFASDADGDSAETVWNYIKAFDGRSYITDGSGNMSRCYAHSKYKVEWLSDNKAYLPFGFELVYTAGFTTTDKEESIQVLALEDGEWKLCKIMDGIPWKVH